MGEHREERGVLDGVGMDEKEFETLLKNFENKDLDFKQELPDSENVAELVTAFYNSRGGRIIIGVEDETRKPIGLKNPQETEHRFTQIIRHWCKLDEEPRIEFIKYKNMDFVAINCPKGRDTPYFVKGQPTPRVRIGSSNMPANKEEIARLYREGSSESQDAYPVKNATLGDMDMEKVKRYLMRSNLTKQLDGDYLVELMLKERFIMKENGNIIPTMAGILLFGKDPYLNIPFSEVKADRYVGDTRTEWLDRRDIRGNLFEILKQTEEFFMRNMRTPARVVGFETKTRTEYPIEALREGIINALAHRDWHSPETILIRMYNSFLEILSPGELLRPLTIGDLKMTDYVPVTRNRTIAGVFNNTGAMDKRGTGFLRIREMLKKWGLPEQEFEERQGWFVIRFRNPYVEKIREMDTTGLNDRQKKAIEFIKIKGRITNREYRELTGLSHEGVKKDIMALIEKNMVTRKGKGRSTHYVLRVAD